jgi:hypothetical protein
MKSRRPVLRIVCGMLVVASLAGCSDGRPARVPVTGKVLIDGAPLAYGQVLFHARNHRPATGKIQPDGSFELATYERGDGCVVGEHVVTVHGGEAINATTMLWHSPPKYSQAAGSGLSATVVEGMEPVTIELTWGGGKPFKERISGGE